MDKNNDGTLAQGEILDYFVAYMCKEEVE